MQVSHDGPLNAEKGQGETVNQRQVCRFIVFNATFNEYFSYIASVSFIDGGNWNTREKKTP